MADFIEITDELLTYIDRYGGCCRDCADSDIEGLCPNTYMPCEPHEAKKAIRHVLKALNYGVKHGYVAATAEHHRHRAVLEELEHGYLVNHIRSG